MSNPQADWENEKWHYEESKAEAAGFHVTNDPRDLLDPLAVIVELRSKLESWENGCVCTDKTRASVQHMMDRLRFLERMVEESRHKTMVEVYAERDRYRAALEQIADSTSCYSGCINIARTALHPE